MSASTSQPVQTRMIAKRPPKAVETSPFDPDSPLFVAKAIIASGVAGGAFGGVAGFQQNLNPVVTAIGTGQRWLVIGAAFFGTREYLVSPLLLSAGATSSHVRRLEGLSAKQRGKLPEGPLTLEDIRHNRVLDSAIAGGLSFGAYSAVTRGISVAGKATFTAALASTLLQYTVNYSRIARIRYLSKDTDGSIEDQPQIMPLGEQIRRSAQRPLEDIDVPGEHTLVGKVLYALSWVAPLKKITPEESYQKLMGERDRLDRKLLAIEKEENRIYEAAERRMEQRKAEQMKRV